MCLASRPNTLRPRRRGRPRLRIEAACQHGRATNRERQQERASLVPPRKTTDDEEDWETTLNRHRVST
jgi:hypothetical protein